MGAWGVGIFENDDAADWLYDYLETGAVAVTEVFGFVSRSLANGYVEAPAGAMGLAAASVVAACFDASDPAFDKGVVAEMVRHRDAVRSIDNGVGQAIAAVETISLDVEKSELRQLWADSGDFAAFDAVNADLLNRLRRVA